MGGIVGRLFREFAMTLSLAILISMAISLTTTPMMCALFLRIDPEPSRAPPRRSLFQRVQDFYARTLGPGAGPQVARADVLVATVALNVWLLSSSEGIFPRAGHRPHRRRAGRRPEHVVPAALSRKLTADDGDRRADKDDRQRRRLYRHGRRRRSSQTNTGAMFLQLKPLASATPSRR